jgi:hypothetical protein
MRPCVMYNDSISSKTIPFFNILRKACFYKKQAKHSVLMKVHRVGMKCG